MSMAISKMFESDESDEEVEEKKQGKAHVDVLDDIDSLTIAWLVLICSHLNRQIWEIIFQYYYIMPNYQITDLV